jgi:ankyrin repeat protein
MKKFQNLESELVCCAIDGNLDRLNVLLDQNSVDVHCRENLALRFAVQYEQKDIVKSLIDHGANVNDFEDEALFMATMNGFTDIGCLLIDASANVNARKCMIFNCACRLGGISKNSTISNPNYVQKFIDAGVDESKLQINYLWSKYRGYVNSRIPEVLVNACKSRNLTVPYWEFDKDLKVFKIFY